MRQLFENPTPSGERSNLLLQGLTVTAYIAIGFGIGDFMAVIGREELWRDSLESQVARLVPYASVVFGIGSAIVNKKPSNGFYGGALSLGMVLGMYSVGWLYRT